MPKLLNILLVLAVLSMPGYGAWIVWTEKLTPEQETAPLVRAPATVAHLDLRYSPRAKMRYTYGFTRKLSFRGLNVPTLSFSGEFYVDVTASDKQGFTSVWSDKVKEFPNSPVRVRASLDPEAKKLELSTSELKTDGERQHANVLKDLISLWAFPLEQDTVGGYRASFEEKDGEQKKIKLTYLEAGAPSIFASEHWLSWDAVLGVPKNLRGSERTHHESGSMPLTTESTYTIEFKGMAEIPEQLNSIQWQKTDSLALTPMKEKLDPAELGVTWEKTKGELAAIHSYSSSERLRIFGDLVKLLRAGKISAADLKNLLSRDQLRLGSNSPIFQAIVGTLATVGGKESFAALRAIYTDPECPVSGKGSIQAGLTTTEAPIDSATRDFLAEQARETENRSLAEGAAYALGSSLQNSSNDSSTQNAIQDLHAAWRAAAGNLTAQLSLLDAMGNSGRAEFLPEIRSSMDTRNDPYLQAKAIFSLRYINTGEANGLLGPQLQNPTPTLREAAIEALRQGTWREEFRATLETCAANDPVQKLRSSCQAALQRGSMASR